MLGILFFHCGELLWSCAVEGDGLVNFPTHKRAEMVLTAAEAGSPTSTIRYHRAWVRAERALEGAFFAAFRDPYFLKNETHAAA